MFAKKGFPIDRLFFLKAIIIILASLILGRLFQLQVLEHKKLNEEAVKRYSRTITLPAKRGDILLRNEKENKEYVLATNTTLDLLYVDPVALESRFNQTREKVLAGKIPSTEFPYADSNQYFDDISKKIAEVLDMSQGEVKEKLVEKYNDHVVLLFDPSNEISFLLQENPIPGVYLVNEYDKELEKLQYETEDTKIAYINRLLPEEKDEMRKKIVEIFVDPTQITEEIPENLVDSAKNVLYEQNQIKLIQMARKIYEIIPDYSMDDLQRILTRKLLRFKPLKRRLTLEESKEIQKLNIYGLVLQPESWRLYPEGNLLSNVLGFVDKEGKGQYGLEGDYDVYLRGKDGYKVLDIDNAGNQITVGNEVEYPAVDGGDIVLTIDRSIQQFVEGILEDTVKSFQAQSGQVIIMEPKTGKIMAMASYPDFNPNEYFKVYERDETSGEYLNGIGPEAFYNSAILYTYEPGSTYKVVTVSTALDSGEFADTDTICDEKGFVEIEADGRVFTIWNSTKQAYGCMTFSQLLEKSSNVGALRASLKVGAGVFKNYMGKFGFGEYTDVGFVNENKGEIKDIKDWGKAVLATAGFGQGFTASPLQVIRGIGALANQGKVMRPYIIAEKGENGKMITTDPLEVRRAVMPITARKVTEMMINVVDQGFGHLAQIPGYSVAGKTGTSQVANEHGGGYSTDKYVTSFIGFAPAEDPAFIMLVKIDYPKFQKFGEFTSAPAFNKIGQFVLDYLEVPKDR